MFLTRLELKSTFVMIDCSFTEAHAIQNAYLAATILYCDFYVLQSVSKNLNHHIKGEKDGKTRMDLHKMAMNDFKNLMMLDD